jgi:hypothetical protein
MLPRARPRAPANGGKLSARKLVLRQQVGFDLADAESASDGNGNRFRVERTSRVIRKVSAAAPRAK